MKTIPSFSHERASSTNPGINFDASSKVRGPLGRATLRCLKFVTVADSVPDLDFEQYHYELGTRHLVIDGDNTISRFGSPVVDDHIQTHLKDAREEGFIDEISLVSNNPDRDLARARGAAIEADFVVTPNQLTDMKPFPSMVHQAMHERNAGPEDTIGVGDGITDYLAYLRSGIPTVLVEGYGRSEAQGYPLRPIVRLVETPFRTLGSVAL